MPHISRLFTLILTIFLGWAESGIAQRFYPVHAVIQVIPPVSNVLSEYAVVGKDRLIISLINRDTEHQSLRVRLRLRLRGGNWFSFESGAVGNYPSFTLEPNEPLRLSSSEIAPYFTPEQARQTGQLEGGKLPTGQAEFSVQVVEETTGRPLSDWHSTRAWVEHKKPPLLIAPIEGAQINIHDPLQLLFRWLPRHQDLTDTEYELVLKELPDNGASPSSAFAYGVELLRTRTQTTSFLYSSLREIPLLSDRRYAWQVQALKPGETLEQTSFEHNGLSEICSFRLQSPCPAPSFLRLTPRKAIIHASWGKVAKAENYLIQYRESGVRASHPWQEVRTEDTEANLQDLVLGKRYTVRVGAVRGHREPTFTPEQEILLPYYNADALAHCGETPVMPRRDRVPLEHLSVGDTVTVGVDFPMTIRNVQSEGGGIFSGEGSLPLPLPFTSEVRVRFEHLALNHKKEQIGGTITALRDSRSADIQNTDEWDDGGREVRPAPFVFPRQSLPFSLPPLPDEGKSVDYDEETGEALLYDLEGNTQRITVPKNALGQPIFPSLLVGKDGREYEITPEEDNSGGKSLSKGKKRLHLRPVRRTKGKVEIRQLDPQLPFVVRFSRGNGRFALDEGKEAWYQRAIKLDNYYRPFSSDYIAPWKLIPIGEGDVVQAYIDWGKESTQTGTKGSPQEAMGEPQGRLPHNSTRLSPDTSSGTTPTFSTRGATQPPSEIDVSKVVFASEDGRILPAQYDQTKGNYRLHLSSVGSSEEYAVFALYDGRTVGKLRVVSYPKVRLKICLIPIAGVNTPQLTLLTDSLQRIFSPYGISLDVKVDPSQQGYHQEGLSPDKADNLKALRAYYLSQTALNPETYYLFLLPEVTKESGQEVVRAQMPRNDRFGYIFAGNSPNLPRLIAHELGHGAFALRHTFDSEYGGERSFSKTQNLMDYAGGTQLASFQWNALAFPAPFTLADSKHDSRFAGGLVLSPDLKLFQVKGSTQFIPVPEKYKRHIVVGTLPTFISNGKSYVWDGTRYINSLDSTDVYHHEHTHSDTLSIRLFYNTDKPCGKVSLILLPREQKARLRKILDSHDTYGLMLLVQELSQNKQLTRRIPCKKEEDAHDAPGDGENNLLDCTGGNIPELVKKAIEEIDRVSTSASPEQIGEILQKHYSPCVFANIPIKTRVRLLNTLIQDDVDDRYWEFSKGSLSTGDHFFLGDLILSTAGKDQLQLMQESLLKDNFRGLRILYEKSRGNSISNNDVTLREMLPVFEGLASWTAKHYKALGVQQTLQSITDIGIKALPSYTYPSASVSPVYLGTEDDGLFPIDIEEEGTIYRPRMLRSVEVDYDRGLTFKYHLRYEPHGESVYPTGQPPLPSIHEPTLSVHPLEPVVMLAAQPRLSLGIEAGREYIAPAFLAAAYAQAITDQHSDEELRSLGNTLTQGIAAGTALFSGGTSLVAYTTYIAGVASTLDEALKAERLKLDRDASYREKYGRAFALWEHIYNTTQISDAGAGLFSLARSLRNLALVKNVKSFVKKVHTQESLQANPTLSKLAKALEANGKALQTFEQTLKGRISKISGCLPKASRELREALHTLSPDESHSLLLDLTESSRAKELEQLLLEAHDLEAWRLIHADPTNAWDVIREDIRWEKWARAEFFIERTQQGREFGKMVASAIESKSHPLFHQLEAFLGKDLKGYKIATEVELFFDKANEKYMRADIVLVKIEERRKFVDFIIIENKLRPTSPLTKNQAQTFQRIMRGEAIEIRGAEKRTRLNLSDPFLVKKENIIKISGNGSVSTDDVTLSHISQ